MPKDRQRRQDLDDFNNESAGRENTGRARRFFPESHRQREQQRKRDHEARMTRLAMMLADPAYAAAYQAAWDSYDRAQDELDRQLLRAAESIERLTEFTDDLKRRASRLHGAAVFRGADGLYYREDGTQLSDDEAALVQRVDNAPSYEQFAMGRDALDQAAQRRARLLGIQTDVLDRAHAELSNDSDPLTVDEVRRWTDRLDVTAAALNTSEARLQFDNARQNPESSISQESGLELSELVSAQRLIDAPGGP